MTTATTYSPEETAELLKLFDLGMRKVRFWQDNYDRLLPEYDGQFVACDLVTGEVVGSAEHLFPLVDDLRERGFNLSDDMSIQRITSQEANYLS